MIPSRILLKSDKEYSSKPEIRFGGYFFQWDNTVGFSLSPDEINSFRNFVKKVIPYLEVSMRLLQNEPRSRPNNTFHEKKKLFLEEKHNSLISFLLFVDIDGKTTFYRQEKCDLIDNEKFKGVDDRALFDEQSETGSDNLAKQNNYRSVDIKWVLGELFFDRTEKSK